MSASAAEDAFFYKPRGIPVFVMLPLDTVSNHAQRLVLWFRNCNLHWSSCNRAGKRGRHLQICHLLLVHPSFAPSGCIRGVWRGGRCLGRLLLKCILLLMSSSYAITLARFLCTHLVYCHVLAHSGERSSGTRAHTTGADTKRCLKPSKAQGSKSR